MAHNKSRSYREFKARLKDLTIPGKPIRNGKDEVLDRLQFEVEKALRRNHRVFNAYNKF